MGLQRTNVYADEDDLRLIKEAAKRRGVSEAELIREGIHLIAISNKPWEPDGGWPTFSRIDGGSGPATKDDVREAVAPTR